MSGLDDYFKCRDCEDEYRCPVATSNGFCDIFSPKKKVKLPIERNIYHKIYLLNTGESITFSEKEIFILLEVLDKDMRKGCVIGD